MQIFEQHERFEINVLKYMNSNCLLKSLVFGGGTMLRLCHELQRYSVYLNFYFKKDGNIDLFYQNIILILSKNYNIVDHKNKLINILAYIMGCYVTPFQG